MSQYFATYQLKHAIVRVTRAAGESEPREEELKPAGFSVCLRRPRATDLKVMDEFEGREIAGSLALLARVSNLDSSEVDLLDFEDFGELGNLLSQPSENGQ